MPGSAPHFVQMFSFLGSFQEKIAKHLFVFSLLGLVPHWEITNNCVGSGMAHSVVCVTHCVAVVHLIFYAYTYVCKYVDQQQLGYHAGHQEASRYHTRGESEESITHR